MPCDHKFKQYLTGAYMDYEPETLIVGTFNPEWPADNAAAWFYGRTDEWCFWDVLPRIYGKASLTGAAPDAWKQFCREHKVMLTDLISCIEDADENNAKHSRIIGGFSDNAIIHNFDDLEYVNIVQLLQRYPSIKNVYLTRGTTEAFWKHLWNPVAYYCNKHCLHEKRLLTPDSSAQYQYEAYNNEHPETAIARLEDYILNKWRQEWHY